MSLRVGAYATVWNTRNENGRVSVNLSTSRKDKDGQYITDWSGWLTVYNDQDEMLSLPPKTRIVIDEFAVSNRYNKEKGQTNTYYNLFKFHLADTTPRDTAPAMAAATSVTADEEVPF